MLFCRQQSGPGQNHMRRRERDMKKKRKCIANTIALFYLFFCLMPPVALSQTTPGNKKAQKIVLNSSSAAKKIVPKLVLSPPAIGAGLTTTVVFSIYNGNEKSNSEKLIMPDDRFDISLDPASDLQIQAIVGPVVVKSDTLLAEDFNVSIAADQRAIYIGYLGSSKVFAPGEFISVKASVTASNNSQMNILTFTGPSDARRYATAQPYFNTLTVVDIPSGISGLVWRGASKSDL